VHIVQRNCAEATCPWTEKMTSDQETLIKRRKPGRDVAECWYDVWDILFPGEMRPASIYADAVSEHAHHAANFFTDRAPAELRDFLHERLDGAEQQRNFETVLGLALPDFVSEVVERLRPVVVQANSHDPRPRTQGRQARHGSAGPFLQVPMRGSTLQTPPSSGRNRARLRRGLDRGAAPIVVTQPAAMDLIELQSPAGGAGILPSPQSSDTANILVDYNWDDELEAINPTSSPLGNPNYQTRPPNSQDLQNFGSHLPMTQPMTQLAFCEIPSRVAPGGDFQFRPDVAITRGSQGVPQLNLPELVSEWTLQQMQEEGPDPMDSQSNDYYGVDE